MAVARSRTGAQGMEASMGAVAYLGGEGADRPG